MGVGLVARLAGQLSRPQSAAQRRVLEAVGRGEVKRWPTPGGDGPPAQDTWAAEPGKVRWVGASMRVLVREELAQLLDAPAAGAAQPYTLTPLGHAVVAALAGQPYQCQPDQPGEGGGRRCLSRCCWCWRRWGCRW